MSKPPIVSEELARRLELAADELRNENNAGSLREIQRFLWDRSDVSDDIDAEFIVFFLNTFIDKVFYNLTGDVPFVEGVTKETQRVLCKRIGEICRDLSGSVRSRDRAALYNSYTELVHAYRAAVRTLNERL